MGEVIGDMIFFGLGIAVGPMPIIVAILLLTGKRGQLKGMAYLIGWVVGLGFLQMVIFSLVRGRDFSHDSTPSRILSWALVLAGIALLVLAYTTWRRRPPAGTKAELPRWLQAIHRITPPLALGIGLFFGLVSVKNLLFASAAAATVGRSHLSIVLGLCSILLFITIATAGIAAPVYVTFAKGEAAQTILDGWVEWLGTNNALIVSLLGLFFGVRLLGDGIGGLF